MVIAKQHSGILLWAAAPLAAVCCQKRKNGGLDFSKPLSEIWKMSIGKSLSSSGLFFSAAGQIVHFYSKGQSSQKCHRLVIFQKILLFVKAHMGTKIEIQSLSR